MNKLNKLGSDLNGTNGRQNVPTSTYDFLQRLKDVLSSESPACIAISPMFQGVEARFTLYPSNM